MTRLFFSKKTSQIIGSLSILIQIGLVCFLFNKGLDYSDEGFSLLLHSYNQEQIITPFTYTYFLKLFNCDLNIYSARTLRLTLLLFSTLFFAFSFLFYLRKFYNSTESTFYHISIFILASLTSYNCYGPNTLTYNHWNSFFLLISIGLCLIAFCLKEKKTCLLLYFTLGLVIPFIFFVKFTTFILVFPCLLFLFFFYSSSLSKFITILFFFIFGIIFNLFLTHNFVLDIDTMYDSIFNTVQYNTQSINEKYDPLSFVKQVFYALKDIFWITSIICTLKVYLMLYNKALSIPSMKIKLLTRSTSILLILFISWVLYHFNIYLGVIYLIPLIYLIVFEQEYLLGNIRSFKSSILIGLLFFLPFIGGFGSNNEYLINVLYYIPFWIMSVILIINNHNNKEKLRIYLMCFVSITSLFTFIYGHILNPYRTDSLFELKHEYITKDNEHIYLDKESNNFLNKLTNIYYQNGFKSGDKLLTTPRLYSLVYILDGIQFGGGIWSYERVGLLYEKIRREQTNIDSAFLLINNINSKEAQSFISSLEKEHNFSLNEKFQIIDTIYFKKYFNNHTYFNYSLSLFKPKKQP